MKNKIALICNTYIRNYGSILQSYAMYSIVKQLGYDVNVINYKDIPRGITTQIKLTLFIRIPMLFRIKEIKKKINSIIATNQKEYVDIIKKRSKAMDTFVHNNFTFTKKCNSISDVRDVIEDYDKILIGSDQLWGIAEIIRDYHTLNFVPENKPKIAYATSFGVDHLPKFIHSATKRFLKRINQLSVRESSGAQIIKNISDRTAKVVVDPTLLISAEEWSSIAGERKIKEPYIFCFFLGNNPIHRNFAKQFQMHTNLPIVSMLYLDEYIPSDTDYANIYINDASPNEFINLIKNAEYIICDSFHASVFSIIFKKHFFTLDRYKQTSSNSRNTRIHSLFQKLGITNHHIDINSNIDNLLKMETDYNIVHLKLNAWKNMSLEYLKEALHYDTNN